MLVHTAAKYFNTKEHFTDLKSKNNVKIHNFTADKITFQV